MTKDEAQRHLKVINSIRTFYDAVKFCLRITKKVRQSQSRTIDDFLRRRVRGNSGDAIRSSGRILDAHTGLSVDICS
jgi:hypothetical protein